MSNIWKHTPVLALFLLLMIILFWNFWSNKKALKKYEFLDFLHLTALNMQNGFLYYNIPSFSSRYLSIINLIQPFIHIDSNQTQMGNTWKMDSSIYHWTYQVLLIEYLQ